MTPSPAAVARLVEVESRLRLLEPALDVARPSTPMEIIALTLCHRARSLYHGVLHALGGPSEATAQVALRALVEQTILLAWLLTDAEVHPFLWNGENARHLRKLVRNAPTMAGSMFASGLAAHVSIDKAAELDRLVADARNRALTNHVLGVHESGSLLPNFEVMTNRIGTPEAKEAYNVVYNMLSGWAHASAGDLGMKFTAGGVVIDDGPVDDTVSIRATAAISYLYIMKLASASAEMPIGEEAEALRQELLTTA